MIEANAEVVQLGGMSIPSACQALISQIEMKEQSMLDLVWIGSKPAHKDYYS
jgi:hypothetical protein